MSELNQEPQAQETQTRQNTKNEGQRLIFADGTTVENAACGYSDGCLWCWLPNYTMQAASLILFDPAKTARIVYEYGAMYDEYVGFTNCTNLFIDGDGKVSGCLKRGN
jgi:hypothetical protein